MADVLLSILGNKKKRLKDMGDGTHAEVVFSQSSATAINKVDIDTPPASTNAGAETVLTFEEPITNLLIQNNTTEDINLNFDNDATAGSYLLSAGQERSFNFSITDLHILTASAQAINGNAAGNIFIQGWN